MLTKIIQIILLIFNWQDPESLMKKQLMDLEGGPCFEGIIDDVDLNGKPTADTTPRISMRISQLPCLFFFSPFRFSGVGL